MKVAKVFAAVVPATAAFSVNRDRAPNGNGGTCRSQAALAEGLAGQDAYPIEFAVEPF
jgi:hypothetical protein